MANPNIVNVTTITGKNARAALTTSDQNVVENAASSGKIFKINSIIAANIDGSSSADLTIRVLDGATSVYPFLASTVAVPADATLVVIDKNSSIYLTENQKLDAKASASGDIDLFISYEEIS